MIEPAAIKSTHPRFEQLYKEREAEVLAASALLEGPGLAEKLARLHPRERAQIIEGLSTFERARLLYAWPFWCRPKQREPEHHPRFWLIQSGRDFGKNMTASQWIRSRIEAGALTLALIGPTLVDIAKYQIGGESGLYAAFPPHQRPIHREDKRLIIFPSHLNPMTRRPVEMHVITAEEPDWVGGNVDTVAWDEFAKCKHRARLLDQLEFNLRSPDSGLECQALFTSTPRPVPEMKELLLDPECYTVIGDSRENAVNMDKKTLARWIRKYDGTRLGIQEMGGRVVADNPGAMFSKSSIEKARVLVDERQPSETAREFARRVVDELPELVDIVIAIDPGVGTGDRNDPTGIAAVGADAKGDAYILETAAGRWLPEEWGSRSIAMHDTWGASAIVVERNRVGNTAASTLRAAAKGGRRMQPKIVDVEARQGKKLRADPVALMAEQGRVHFVGVHPETEAEMTEWDPSGGGASPNRLDAVVWGVTFVAKIENDEDDQSFDGAELDAANAMLAGGAPLAATPKDARPDHYAADERRNGARGGGIDDLGRWGRGTI